MLSVGEQCLIQLTKIGGGINRLQDLRQKNAVILISLGTTEYTEHLIAQTLNF